VAQLFSLGGIARMKLTTGRIVAGFVLLVVLFALFIWLTFDVFPIFRIANVVSGGQ
jgi:hypothetical protein